MKSRWLVAAAGLCGVVAAPALAWSCIAVTIPFTYDTDRPLLLIAFLVFTVLTVPAGLLVVWAGTPLMRGFAGGLLIGWAAWGFWAWMGVPGLSMT